MKTVKIDELQKGDLILVRWFDASELRGKLDQHDAPEVAVWEWGIFLGLRGKKRKHLLLGKDLVEGWNEWGAARIPLPLIDKVILISSRSLQEIFKTGVLKKIKLRPYRQRIKVRM